MYPPLETKCPQKLIGRMTSVALCTGLPSWLAVQRTAALHTVKSIVDLFHSTSFSTFITKKYIFLFESVPLIHFQFSANYIDGEVM